MIDRDEDVRETVEHTKSSRLYTARAHYDDLRERYSYEKLSNMSIVQLLKIVFVVLLTVVVVVGTIALVVYILLNAKTMLRRILSSFAVLLITFIVHLLVRWFF